MLMTHGRRHGRVVENGVAQQIKEDDRFRASVFAIFTRSEAQVVDEVSGRIMGTMALTYSRLVLLKLECISRD